MLIFVPRHMDRDFDLTPEMQVKRLIAVPENDFNKIVHKWVEWTDTPPDDEDPTAYDALTVCAKDPITGKTGVEFGAFRDFLLRPTIVMFGGASEGTDEETAKIIMHEAYRLGELIAEKGFNLRYGGGLKGLMGQTLLGFKAAQERMILEGRAFADQKSLQVLSGYFMNGVSKNGFRAPNHANEKLCKETDGAVIVPGKLSRRKSMMREHATALCLLPGAIGSPDELYDAVTLVKIGAENKPVYMADPFVPDLLRMGLPRRYYQDLFDYNKRVMLRGMVSKAQNDSFIRRALCAENMIGMVLQDLEAQGKTPQKLYEENCARYLPPVEAVRRIKAAQNLALG